MSSMLMLPDVSTASSRSRPERGTSSGAPSHCGRAAAKTSSAQPSKASAVRKRGTGETSACCGKRETGVRKMQRGRDPARRARQQRAPRSAAAASASSSQGQASSNIGAPARQCALEPVAREFEKCRRIDARRCGRIVRAAIRRIDQCATGVACENATASAFAGSMASSNLPIEKREPCLALQRRGLGFDQQRRAAQQLRNIGGQAHVVGLRRMHRCDAIELGSDATSPAPFAPAAQQHPDADRDRGQQHQRRESTSPAPAATTTASGGRWMSRRSGPAGAFMRHPRNDACAQAAARARGADRRAPSRSSTRTPSFWHSLRSRSRAAAKRCVHAPRTASSEKSSTRRAAPRCSA